MPPFARTDLRRSLLLAMARYHISSPYVFLWRTIEVSALVDLARAYEIDLRAGVDLDVGCGNGVLGHALLHQIGVGFDPQPAPLHWAAARKPSYQRLLCASATHIPLPDQSQRLVLSNSVLEHIPDDQATLAEIARVLVPGGHLIFSTVSHHFPALMLGHPPSATERAALDASYGHAHYYSLDGLRAQLAVYGLEVLLGAYYITQRQARLIHRLRSWQHRQRNTGVWLRLNQLRRAALSATLLPLLMPTVARDGRGAGLGVLAVRRG